MAGGQGQAPGLQGINGLGFDGDGVGEPAAQPANNPNIPAP